MRINMGGHNGPQGSSAVPAQYYAVVESALRLLRKRIARHACTSFSGLPGGRTLSSRIASEIWINFDPSTRHGDWGWTIPSSHPNDIVITAYTCRMGRWSLAGTIVHELAHLNGADGHSHAAEETLRGCGLESPAGPYSPGVTG
jgi:hypothetical protein